MIERVKPLLPPGWTVEFLQGSTDVLVIERATGAGGGFVAIDTRKRFFTPGYAQPHRNFAPEMDWAAYVGLRWLERIFTDACKWLETTMA